MTAKKHWFSRVSSDSPDGNSDTEISWITSDSDGDEGGAVPSKKRRKLNVNNSEKNAVNSWISINIKMTETPKDCRHCNESPIIGAIPPDNMSPIVPQLSCTFIKEMSPIIGSRDVLRKIKNLHKLHLDEKLMKEVKNISADSPEQILTQSSQLISSSQLSGDEMVISMVPSAQQSQYSCQIAAIDSATGSSTKSGSNGLYHQLRPQRKRYKKGGLARQLHTVLKRHNTSLGIWQHELDTCKDVTYDYKGFDFVFEMITSWQEYGCVIFECRYITRPKTGTNSLTKFILLPSSPSIALKIDVQYKMLPSYSTKTVTYQKQQLICYFSVSRIVAV